MSLSIKGAMRLGAGALATTLMCGVASSVMAGEAPMAVTAVTAADIAAMRARLDALEAALDTTNTNVSALQTPTGGATTATLSNGRPAFASADKRFTAQIRAVAMFDAAYYDQDEPTATDVRRTGDALIIPAQDLNSGTNFRRSRLGVEGKLFNDFDYGFIYEFGGSGAEEPGRIQEAWVQYSAYKPFRLRVGAFEPNSGLAASTSTSGMSIMERPASAEIVRNLAAGDSRSAVQLQANGLWGDDTGLAVRWFASGAVTGSTVAAANFDEQLGYVGRVAIAPYTANGLLVHMGFNGQRVVTPSDTTGVPATGYVVRYRDRPELRVDGNRFVDTANIIASGATAYGVELGLQFKNFLFEGEKFRFGADRRIASPAGDPEFDGFYVQGSWMLTGETRTYDAVSAVFGAPRPNVNYAFGAGSWGAFELAARYSEVDLNYLQGLPNTAVPTGGIRGGEQTIRTIGLNWFPNPSVKFMLDYLDVEIDRLAPTANYGGGTVPLGAQIGQKYNALAFRTQVAF